jgi:hypothetical protein
VLDLNGQSDAILVAASRLERLSDELDEEVRKPLAPNARRAIQGDEHAPDRPRSSGTRTVELVEGECHATVDPPKIERSSRTYSRRRPAHPVRLADLDPLLAGGRAPP